MRKKATKNMLIRDLPVDQWELVDSFCRRRKMKRREFVSLALTKLEGQETGKRSSRKDSKEMALAAAELQMVATQVENFKSIISLKKAIDKLYDDLKYLKDFRTAINIYLELERLQLLFIDLTKKLIPWHDIPDDPEARRKMGLPEEYVSEWVDVPADYERNLNGHKPVNEGENAGPQPASSEEPGSPKNKGQANHDVEKEGGSGNKLVPLEVVESCPTGEAKANKKIKTTVFGRGFGRIVDDDK
jgi:hypothetical protein